MNKSTVIFFLLIFGLVVGLQSHPEVYNLFLGSMGTVYVLSFGMVAKGHNHGLCRKCSQEHVHGMSGKHHSTETKQKISKANSGHSTTPETRLKQSLVKKGKPLSPTHYAHLVEANKSPSKRLAISLTSLAQFRHGRVSGRKGKVNSLAHRFLISLAWQILPLEEKLQRGEKISIALTGLKRSPLTRLRIKIAKLKYWSERRRESVGKLYNLPESVVCHPSNFYDHLFSRRVLIEQSEFRPYIEHTGLREIPTFTDKNGEVKVIVPLLGR